jgi:hypothetical protein
MEGLGEIGLGCGVASVTKFRLSLGEQPLRFLGVMRRMTIQTADVVAGMGRATEVGLAGAVAVTAQATSAGLLPGEFFEANDLGDVASAVDMGGTGSVAGLASVTIL